LSNGLGLWKTIVESSFEIGRSATMWSFAQFRHGVIRILPLLVLLAAIGARIVAPGLLERLRLTTFDFTNEPIHDSPETRRSESSILTTKAWLHSADGRSREQPSPSCSIVSLRACSASEGAFVTIALGGSWIAFEYARRSLSLGGSDPDLLSCPACSAICARSFGSANSHVSPTYVSHHVEELAAIRKSSFKGVRCGR
jgi:hypothetical protein